MCLLCRRTGPTVTGPEGVFVKGAQSLEATVTSQSLPVEDWFVSVYDGKSRVVSAPVPVNPGARNVNATVMISAAQLKTGRDYVLKLERISSVLCFDTSKTFATSASFEVRDLRDFVDVLRSTAKQQQSPQPHYAAAHGEREDEMQLLREENKRLRAQSADLHKRLNARAPAPVYAPAAPTFSGGDSGARAAQIMAQFTKARASSAVRR